MTKERAIKVIDCILGDETLCAGCIGEETTSCVECRREVADMAIEALKKQKTGKWIVHTEIENVYGGIYIECSECGESYVVQHLDAEIFCRTCGSKNGR